MQAPMLHMRRPLPGTGCLDAWPHPTHPSSLMGRVFECEERCNTRGVPHGTSCWNARTHAVSLTGRVAEVWGLILHIRCPRRERLLQTRCMWRNEGFLSGGATKQGVGIGKIPLKAADYEHNIYKTVRFIVFLSNQATAAPNAAYQ